MEDLIAEAYLEDLEREALLEKHGIPKSAAIIRAPHLGQGRQGRGGRGRRGSISVGVQCPNSGRGTGGSGREKLVKVLCKKDGAEDLNQVKKTQANQGNRRKMQERRDKQWIVSMKKKLTHRINLILGKRFPSHCLIDLQDQWVKNLPTTSLLRSTLKSSRVLKEKLDNDSDMD